MVIDQGTSLYTTTFLDRPVKEYLGDQDEVRVELLIYNKSNEEYEPKFITYVRDNQMDKTIYKWTLLPKTSEISSNFQYANGWKNFANILRELDAEETHKVMLSFDFSGSYEVPSKTVNSTFDLTITQGGMKQLEKVVNDIEEKEIANTRMPQSKYTNATYDSFLKQELNKLGYSNVKRVVWTTSGGWATQTTKEIYWPYKITDKRKVLKGTFAYELEGKCYMEDIALNKYMDGDDSKKFLNGLGKQEYHTRISCDNINK